MFVFALRLPFFLGAVMGRFLFFCMSSLPLQTTKLSVEEKQ